MGWDNDMAFRDCPWCGLRHGQMNVLSTNTTVPAAATRRSRTWAFMTCPACGGAIAVETSSPQETSNHEIGVVPEEIRVIDVDHLPEDVARYYGDARRVLLAGVPDAAAVQLRRTLEAAAAHFEVKAFPLASAIKKLTDKGLITKQFSEVFDHVRSVGNIGAHATDARLEHAEVDRALRFTTQVLRNLFEIPAQLAALSPDDSPASS